MTIATAAPELVIPGLVAVMASLFSDGIFTVVVGLSVAAFCFQGA